LGSKNASQGGESFCDPSETHSQQWECSADPSLVKSEVSKSSFDASEQDSESSESLSEYSTVKSECSECTFDPSEHESESSDEFFDVYLSGNVNIGAQKIAIF